MRPPLSYVLSTYDKVILISSYHRGHSLLLGPLLFIRSGFCRNVSIEDSGSNSRGFDTGRCNGLCARIRQMVDQLRRTEHTDSGGSCRSDHHSCESREFSNLHHLPVHHRRSRFRTVSAFYSQDCRQAPDVIIAIIASAVSLVGTSISERIKSRLKRRFPSIKNFSAGSRFE